MSYQLLAEVALTPLLLTDQATVIFLPATAVAGAVTLVAARSDGVGGATMMRAEFWSRPIAPLPIAPVPPAKK